MISLIAMEYSTAKFSAKGDSKRCFNFQSHPSTWVCFETPHVKSRSILLYVHGDADEAHTLEWARAKGAVKFTMETVAGFYEAVDYLLAQGKFASAGKHAKPAIILVDYSLGSYKGSDLVRWIHEQLPLSNFPVVILSRSTEIPQMAESYASGADCYLVKPDDFEGMLHMVRCLDECLQQNPSSLSALREVSPHADLARDALRIELREGLARHRKLAEEQKAQTAKLDATMAEQKERKKQIPFVSKEPRKPESG
jgi:DNA-binding response OmpR family regulator